MRSYDVVKCRKMSFKMSNDVDGVKFFFRAGDTTFAIHNLLHPDTGMLYSPV